MVACIKSNKKLNKKAVRVEIFYFIENHRCKPSPLASSDQIPKN